MVIGAYAYHFWMAAMTPLRRVSGNQYLHHKSEDYRNAVRRKIACLSSPHPTWSHRPGPAADPLRHHTPSWFGDPLAHGSAPFGQVLAPSEQVVAVALRQTLPEFLATCR